MQRAKTRKLKTTKKIYIFHKAKEKKLQAKHNYTQDYTLAYNKKKYDFFFNLNIDIYFFSYIWTTLLRQLAVVPVKRKKCAVCLLNIIHTHSFYIFTHTANERTRDIENEALTKKNIQ